MFLVGMAGYGGQDVFKREVDSVAKLFRERFDADGRIVKLVNNPRTLKERPVASATSLEASLKRVAASMDPDEDVLVLFLTSHGSQDHQLTLEMRPFQLRQITPPMLKRMLDASGIRKQIEQPRALMPRIPLPQTTLDLIVKYLAEQKAQNNSPVALVALQPRGALRGERLYQQHCATCHGEAGKGDGPNAALLR